MTDSKAPRVASSFAANIKARRQALGFTLRDVEQITDGTISNSYLSQLENGKIKSPSAHVVLQLCAAYAVKHQDALSWLGEKVHVTPPRICGECGQAIRLRE